ncbi:hypothetical protein ACA910_001281 [Epithemia clementina (nom. ined.)]
MNTSSTNVAEEQQQQQQPFHNPAADEEEIVFGDMEDNVSLEGGGDEEKEPPARIMSPTLDLPQDTQHHNEAKTLLERVLEEHRNASAKGYQHHRKTSSRVPQQLPFLPELGEPNSQAGQQQQQAPPPPPQDAPDTPDSRVGKTVHTADPSEPPPYVTTSLADTTQYLIALHQHHESKDAIKSKNHHHKNNKNLISDYTAAVGALDSTNNDRMEEAVETIHPADRVYAAAAVLKAAARFQQSRPNNNKKNKPPPAVVSSSAATPVIQNTDVENPTAAAAAAANAADGAQSLGNTTDDDDDRTVSTDGGGQRRSSWLTGGRPYKGKRKARRAKFGQALAAVKQEWNSLHDFFQPTTQNLKDQFVFVCWALMLPCLAVSVILFYFVGNPPTGRCKNNIPCGYNSNNEPVASAAWWVLFLGVRQVITWLLARLSDIFFFDWLVLQHPRLIRLMGPQISLIIIQSKGWPSVMLWWALWNFMTLQGNGPFISHWLYWQDYIKLFTNENPSGDIPSSEFYRHVLITMVVVAVSVSVKRNILSLHLGRRLYLRFNERLTELMEEIALISELALWARRKRDQRATYAVWSSVYAEMEDRPQPPASSLYNPRISRAFQKSIKPKVSSRSSTTSTSMYTTQQSVEHEEALDYDKLLEKWTEPKRGQGQVVHASKIIEFRQAFAVMTKPFFYSSAFGPVESRKECITSADRLFRRLLKLFEDQETVDVSQLVRWMYKGCHLPGQKEKSAHLIILLNPDVNNCLNIVDFVRGIDAIYQRVRSLENAVHNASHIDREYERILNFVFYFILICVGLAILRLDPLTLLLTVSGLIVAISFMIGPGSAVFFEGIMMVLGRQPYDVGDRIAIANVSDMPDFDGSTQWIVENVDLLSTTARLVYTNEVANFSNGSLARSRLINMNRSPDPVVYVYVRFQTDVPYSTITIFRSALEIFVEDRPQEWAGLLGFRTSRVEAQLNFVEYIVILQHRLTWQSLIPIKESRAAVASFCVEIQKQLGCHYSAPPMPVEITMNTNAPLLRVNSSMEDLMETAKQFEAKKEEKED